MNLFGNRMSLTMPNCEEAAGRSKNIKVFVRVQPLLKRCENCMTISPEKKIIFVRCLQNMKQKCSTSPLYWRFKTDGIFYGCSQNDVYRETTGDIIDNVLDGANCVLISCGQTGTGKSFTIGGLRNNWEHRGIVPRLVTDLFAEKGRRKYVNNICYRLSFVEFRGKKFRDLLNPNFVTSDNSNKFDPFKRIKKVAIKTEEDALQYIFRGEARRALGESSIYPACHLGTAVISFHVYNTSLITSRAVISESMIHIVEMAGIDIPGKSSCSKERHDIVAANIMKLELEEFFANLEKSEITSRHFAHSSCLLKYLGDALSITSLIRFIAHVRVTKEDLDVALSTLRLSSKIANLHPIKISYNVKPQKTMLIEQLQEEVERLKRELDINEMFFRQGITINISEHRAEQMEQDFLDFLNGNISDVKLISLCQPQVLTMMMKDLYAKITAEKERAVKNAEKCETELKNITLTSKTNIESLTVLQNTNRKNSRQRSRVSVTRNEVEAENKAEPDKVGTLKNSGITLGPGLSNIPSTTALHAYKLSKVRPETIKEEKLESKRSLENMRKTFETMQLKLNRLIKARSTPRKNRWNTSTIVSKPNR